MNARKSERTSSEIAIWLLKDAIPPRKWLYAIALLSIVGVSVLTAAQAYSTKLIVNDVFGPQATMAPIIVAAFVISVFAGKSIALYVNQIMSFLFNRSVAADYQKRIFNATIIKPVDHFQKSAAAEMAKTIIYGRAAGNAVVGLSNKMLTDGLTLLALGFVMISQAPVLSLFTVFLFPFIYLIVSRLSARIRKLSNDEAAMDGGIYAVGAEAFEGIKTVKSYGIEAKAISRFSETVEQLQKRLTKIATITGATIPLMELLGGLSLTVFVIYVGRQIANADLDAGAYTAFITAFLMAYQPAQRLSGTWVKLQRKFKLVNQMLSVLGDETPPKWGTKLLTEDAKLSISDVHYNFAKNAPALRGISLEFEPGDRVAIVGPSGAGKTTLIDLIQGFYAPTKGQVKIGGIDISELSHKTLLDSIALVTQDVFLFAGSIRENIRDGKPDATDAEIESAAKRAAVLDFTSHMPNGLDSDVGPNGSALSGGQKQRVGLARALLKPARVYIFDEATSALDGETETRVMRETLNSPQQVIVLFITHRQATLNWFERIVVIDNGVLSEGGLDQALKLGAVSRN